MITNYHAWLIRLWRDDEQQPWRVELRSPQNTDVHRFATPQQAYAWIEAEIEEREQGTGSRGQVTGNR